MIRIRKNGLFCLKLILIGAFILFLTTRGFIRLIRNERSWSVCDLFDDFTNHNDAR